MKKINVLYWIATSIFAALMLVSSIPDVMMDPQAVTFMTKLGYPPYFIQFIGWAKILGVIAILTPGFPRVKEWAYAGLAFDLIGATYSQVAIGASASILIMLVWFVPMAASYMLYHRRLKMVAGRIAVA